ncbi:MAG TPA: glutamine synthetase family protein [Thermomicrobiales bacterium]|nr:glutamine synthetase family protein [Thermomicrobiales bacterium]
MDRLLSGNGKKGMTMARTATGKIGVEDLTDMVEANEIDTVVTAVCDMQGRLIGKRVTGQFFVEHCQDHGTHLCTYLLGTDMEMNTPPGYALMNWESGYGDYLNRPDWDTLRVIPWLEKTALVLGDLVDESTGELVPVAPRSILRRQVVRAERMGFRPMMASELEFYLLRDTYEEAAEKGWDALRPWGWYNEDYQLLQATKGEPIYRQFRNLMTEAGVPIEFSKGEAAPGQHEVNIHYADALESADRAAIYKHGAKEIAHQSGCSITFMAKPDQTWTGSSSHVHMSLWDPTGQKNVFADESTSREMSPTMRHFLGGLLAGSRELSLFIASNINSYKRYAVASWAPVNIVWSRDNRTCGFRIVGQGSSLRIEDRLPGGDANPYLAYAAMLAAGLDGIERAIEPPAEFHGNAYEATGVPRVPRSMVEAIQALEQSTLARTAFGDDVVAHYLNMAEVEQRAYDMAVTDWERRRYFERG